MPLFIAEPVLEQLIVSDSHDPDGEHKNIVRDLILIEITSLVGWTFLVVRSIGAGPRCGNQRDSFGLSKAELRVKA
jgi:hypothetical protein